MNALNVYPEGTAPDLSGSEEEVLRRLGTATWWLVPGFDRSRCRVVSTLLHGNEPSGFRAIRTWLAGAVTPAVDTAFCLCSVEAALGPPLFAHRALPGKRDANRCFLPPFDGPEAERARALLDQLERVRPEALVDVHNTTGHSPAYGVGTRLDQDVVGLTALFADRLMHSELHLGTLVEALHERLPSVVIECGRAGDPIADATALAGLERFLTLDDLRSVRARTAQVEVLWRPIRVHIHERATLAFADAPQNDTTLTVRSGIDQHNFRTLDPGALLGWISPGGEWPLVALGKAGLDISHELFAQVGQKLVARRQIVPVMMTTSAAMAKQDCLFYALERRGAPGASQQR
jgi:hypothetical protein